MELNNHLWCTTTATESGHIQVVYSETEIRLCGDFRSQWVKNREDESRRVNRQLRRLTMADSTASVRQILPLPPLIEHISLSDAAAVNMFYVFIKFCFLTRSHLAAFGSALVIFKSRLSFSPWICHCALAWQANRLNIIEYKNTDWPGSGLSFRPVQTSRF